MGIAIRIATILAQDDHVRALIEQLGAEELSERDDAAMRLAEVGVKAEAPLREAVEKHADAEVRQRSREVLGVLERRAIWWRVRAITGAGLHDARLR